MIIIGIDPGNSGAITSMAHSGSEIEIATLTLKASEADIASFLRDQRDLIVPYNIFAYIERVHAFPKAGVTGMFHFGQSYGFLRGVLVTLAIPFEEVLPRKWQQAMGCLSGGDKRITRARAQQLFPGRKVTHATADSLLICEFGRRLRSGELSK